MSQESNDCSTVNMISAKVQCHFTVQELVEEDNLEETTMFCAIPTHEDTTDYALASGGDILIFDGTSNNRVLKRRCDTGFCIKKLFFHTFQVTSAEKHPDKKVKHDEEKELKELCRKARDYLVACGEHKVVFLSLPDYHFYHYEIPFKLRNVFPCNSSILIERFYDASNEQNFYHHDTFHLYSLSGPFGELLPVIYKTNGFSPQWKFCWQSAMDEYEMVGSDQNFVVVFDEKEKVHRVYMARETEEKEVHAAIRHVETIRKQYDSTMYGSSLFPHSASRTNFQTTMSPAIPVKTLSETINSDIDGRSPMMPNIRSGFGHSTPNNQAVGGFQGTLPTPIFDGNNESQIWATTPNTPRVNTRGGLERDIHTRGLARMVDTEGVGVGPSPIQSYGRLQTTSSPYRTHLSHRMKRGDSNAELLRDFTRQIRNTTMNTTKHSQKEGDSLDFGDLERDPDVDLLLSKICLACVYVEPKQIAIPKANNVFISTFLGDMFLNLVSSNGEVMQVIPVWKSVDKTRANLGEKGKHEPVKFDCVEATFVMKSGITVVLGPDFTTKMIGGNERIAPIFIPEISTKRQSRNFRLYPFMNDKIAAVNEMKVTILEIPKTVICDSAAELMKTCFLNLKRDFARNRLLKWRAMKRDMDLERLDMEQQEINHITTFLMDSVGVQIVLADDDERAGTPESHGGKQMRPRVSEAEVNEMMKNFFDDTTFQLEKTFALKKQSLFMIDVDSDGDGFEHVKDLFNSIHAQCEQWTLNTIMHPALMILVPYAFLLSKILRFREFERYYLETYNSYLGQLRVESGYSIEDLHRLLVAVKPPPPMWSLYEIIDHLIDTRTTSETLRSVPKYVPKESLRILTVLAMGRDLLRSEMDMQMWIGQDWPRRLALNKDMCHSFRVILKNSRLDGASRASELMVMFNLDSNHIENLVLAPKIIFMKYKTDAFAGVKSMCPKKCIYATADEMRSISSMRWRHDIRKRNVEMMLNSSRPILIATNVLRKNEDDNMKELQDRFLTQTSYRTFSQPFGRAFYEFRTAVPSLLTTLHVPRLCVGGMVYPARVTCDPPNTESFKLNTDWGNFYNALSAALRIGSSDMVLIDNEWIVMVAKNIKSTAVVGGMILGFGLNGHLANFNMYHAHQMLSKFDKFNSVALLIGMSASYFKSCDNQIHKILATYLSFLMGPTPLEIKLDITIQTAAVAGLGLLFADSGNMNIAKKLVNEIGKAPNKEEEPVTERAAYKLCAGFTLGLIMLGKGNGAASTVVPFKQNIPSLSKRLMYMMNGMRTDQCVFLPQSCAQVVNEVTNLPFSNGGLITSNQTANHVKDNENINIHQSAEPAAIALGLMFMKTHNEFVAEQLALPSTITDLERLKPDSIYSRVLGHCLVMWDKIRPTQKFVNSLIPKVIKEYAYSALHFGIPVKRDEDGEQIHEVFDENEEQYWSEVVDRSTIAQTFLYTVSAACMAIALKYSSCGGPEEKSAVNAAFRTIEFYTKIVLPDGKSNKDLGSVRMCMHAGTYTRSSCLCMMVTAMAILRVGTGDLEVMRYARLLRLCDKPDGDWISMGKKHFEQMVSHQALGILLMGEGRYAFKKDDISIALLVISTFPTIPQNVSDNSHYHQPLRFLWSLAVEPRLLVPFDAGENHVVQVDLSITLKRKTKDGEHVSYKLLAPTLLPPLEDIKSLSVGGGVYEVVHIKLETEEDLGVMKDVMSVGQGRVMLKKYNINKEVDRNTLAHSLYNNPMDIMDMIQNEDAADKLDVSTVEMMMRDFDKSITLNSCDVYPNVQVQLSTVRDVANRTHSNLEQLQKKSLRLLSSSLDLWADEVNVSNTLNGFADGLRCIEPDLEH